MGCLVDAVRRGDVQEVARLLAAGADPNVKDLDGHAPLHIAAEQCRADLAELLLKHGADPNVRDAYGRTPLHRAACLDVADLLIRHGADVNARDGEGYTPATHAFMRWDLDLAAFLLSHGAAADVEAAESPDGVALAGDGIPAGEALLHAVVFAEQVDAVYLLLSRGADPNVRGWRGQTPLHLAIVYEGTSNCRMEAIRLLLKHGADPNARDEHGKTPLHYAAEHCMPDLVELLLKHGADPNARDAEGRTPLHMVFERAANDRWERVMAELTAAALLRHGADPYARDSEGRTPLHYAAARGSLYLKAAEVLVRRGADVNARDRLGRTPLYYAEDGSTVEYLIRRGADPNVRDAEGRTPLRHAAASGRRWTAKALVEAGVEVDEDLAAALRLTPLHLAALRGSAEEAERLLNSGADPNVRDVFFRTPLHYAAARNHKAAAELLLSRGADPNAKDEDGETPLDLAAKWCAAKTGALLAAYGLGPLTLSHAVEAGCVDLIKALPPVYDKQALSAAAWFCDVDVARVLLERGAEADALEAALESAVAAGCVEVVELLLSRGARLRAGLFSSAEVFRQGEVVKVLAKYADEQTLEKALSSCFVMALAVKTPEEAARLLGRGAAGCRAREVEPLLNLGVDPNLRDEEGLAPLHRALMHNDLYNAEVVDLLLSRGADPNVRGRDGNTPLHLAAEFNRVQAAALLLKHGADPNAANARGETPLHIAAGRGRYAVAYLLLQHGADPNAKDAEGNTPLHRAANCRYALAQLLIQHGADPNARNNQGKTPLDLANCPGKMRAFRRLFSGSRR
jgi:ankyrin repeat protein